MQPFGDSGTECFNWRKRCARTVLQRAAFSAFIALALSQPSIAQVNVTVRVDQVSTTPYVERLTMTIQNANSGNAYFRYFGDQLFPDGTGSSGFACARFTPIEENRCVVSNPCTLDEFPDPALCGEIAALTPGVLSCVWQITPAIPGCPSELLEVRGYSTFGDASLSFSFLQRVVRQVPPAAVPLSPPTIVVLAVILLGVGLVTLRAGKR